MLHTWILPKLFRDGCWETPLHQCQWTEVQKFSSYLWSQAWNENNTSCNMQTGLSKSRYYIRVLFPQTERSDSQLSPCSVNPWSVQGVALPERTWTKERPYIVAASSLLPNIFPFQSTWFPPQHPQSAGSFITILFKFHAVITLLTPGP